VKLSICIPTHHGRAATLRVLLRSIAQQAGVNAGDVEICVSDNASEDGTAALIDELRQTSPFANAYHSFPVDVRGVRNFLNVVEMAQGEYCWMIGSDDLVLEGGLAAVLKALTEHPLEAATVNKLNLDHELAHFVGPDASLIVPHDPSATRVLRGFDNVAAELGMLFTYMSTHIFRRRAWQAVVAEHGLERLLWTRHFPHTFVYCQIARREKEWLWIGDYCVAQRLGNYCLLEETGHRESLYAMQVLEDVEKVWTSVMSRDSAAYETLMTRHFIVYWNPFNVRKYLCEPAMTDAEARAMRELAVRCFQNVALFWMTCYPLLILPRSFIRATRPFTSLPTTGGSGASTPNRSGSLRRLLRSLGIKTRWTKEFDFAESVAQRDIARQSE
jgi:abequosyltransferase